MVERLLILLKLGEVASLSTVTAAHHYLLACMHACLPSTYDDDATSNGKVN